MPRARTSAAAPTTRAGVSRTQPGCEQPIEVRRGSIPGLRSRAERRRAAGLHSRAPRGSAATSRDDGAHRRSTTSCTCARPRSSALETRASVRGSDVGVAEHRLRPRRDPPSRRASALPNPAAATSSVNSRSRGSARAPRRVAAATRVRRVARCRVALAASAPVAFVNRRSRTEPPSSCETRIHAQLQPAAERKRPRPASRQSPSGARRRAPSRAVVRGALARHAPRNPRAARPGPALAQHAARVIEHARLQLEPRRQGTAASTAGVDGDAGSPRHERRRAARTANPRRTSRPGEEPVRRVGNRHDCASELFRQRRAAAARPCRAASPGSAIRSAPRVAALAAAAAARRASHRRPRRSGRTRTRAAARCRRRRVDPGTRRAGIGGNGCARTPLSRPVERRVGRCAPRHATSARTCACRGDRSRDALHVEIARAPHRRPAGRGGAASPRRVRSRRAWRRCARGIRHASVGWPSHQRLSRRTCDARRRGSTVAKLTRRPLLSTRP